MSIREGLIARDTPDLCSFLTLDLPIFNIETFINRSLQSLVVLALVIIFSSIKIWVLSQETTPPPMTSLLEPPLLIFLEITTAS